MYWSFEPYRHTQLLTFSIDSFRFNTVWTMADPTLVRLFLWKILVKPLKAKTQQVPSTNIHQLLVERPLQRTTSRNLPYVSTYLWPPVLKACNEARIKRRTVSRDTKCVIVSNGRWRSHANVCWDRTDRSACRLVMHGRMGLTRIRHLPRKTFRYRFSDIPRGMSTSSMRNIKSSVRKTSDVWWCTVRHWFDKEIHTGNIDAYSRGYTRAHL